MARPEDLESRVSDLLTLRAKCGADKRPLIIWEPAPPFCKRAHLEAHLRACKRVDVFSPNHLELLAFFEEDTSEKPFDRSVVESYARRFLTASMQGEAQGAIIVVRAGEHGCLTVSRLTDFRWLPPYYGPTSSKIIDTTGSGNTFLGAFGITLQASNDVVESAIRGTVAASFALEQVGLPKKALAGGRDTWNGEEFTSRLQEYRSRVQVQG